MLRRHTRHNRAGRDGHKTGHQSVFDEVLTALIFPNLNFKIRFFISFSSPLPISAAVLSAATRTVSPGCTFRKSGFMPNGAP